MDSGLTLLGLDTATAVATAGVLQGGRIVAERSTPAAGRHAAEIADLVASVLAEAGLALEDLAGVAVSLGPGSFTGLRVGIGFAQGAAYAASLRLVGVPTLEALAHVAPPGAGNVAACLDARKGEVYLALFRREENGRLRRAGGDLALSLEAAAARIEAHLGDAPGSVVGDAVESHPERFSRVASRALPFSLFHPRGGTVARLGAERLGREGTSRPSEVLPRYVRPSAAEIGAALTRSKTL